jgi:hypothetical protein
MKMLDWAKMPRSASTKRTFRYVKLFCLTGISMFIVIIIELKHDWYPNSPIPYT